MSKRLEAERHLQALDEIRHIMGSMKTLAQLETRKLGRFLATQQQALRNIEAMAADFCSFYAMTPPLAPDARHIYLLLGSERGFCGDFNEAVLQALDEAPGDAEPRLVAVGRKLSLRLEDDSRLIQALDGPDAAEEVEAVPARLAPRPGPASGSPAASTRSGRSAPRAASRPCSALTRGGSPMRSGPGCCGPA